MVDEAVADGDISPTTPSLTPVAFLARLGEPALAHTPDSLLALKLNDLVREPRLIQLFDLYLRDIGAPDHLLDAFLQARDLHARMQAYGADADGESLNEIRADLRQLFDAFVAERAPNRIDFEEEADDTSALTAKTPVFEDNRAQKLRAEIGAALDTNHHELERAGGSAETPLERAIEEVHFL